MNTFLLWVNKGSRKPKVQGKATAAAAALTIFDFSRMARNGRGRFYVVDAPTADEARVAIDTWEKQGLGASVSETKFDGGGKITAIGARANQALEGAGVSISKWDERLAKQGRVTDAQARALNNPRKLTLAQLRAKVPGFKKHFSKGQGKRMRRRHARLRRRTRLKSLRQAKLVKRRNGKGKRKRASRRAKLLRKAGRKYAREFQSAMGFLPVPGTRIRRHGATYRARPLTVATRHLMRNSGNGWIERWHATVYGPPGGKKLVFEQKGYKSPRDPGTFRVKIGSKTLYEGRDFERAEAVYRKAPLW